MAILRRSLAIVVFLFISYPTFAADSGIDGVNLDLYRPAMDGGGIFGVNSPDTLESGRVFLSLSSDWAQTHLLKVDLLPRDLVILQRMATGRFVGALGLNSWITAGVHVPVHYLIQGENFVTTNNYSTSSLGDVGISFKFRLLEENERRPGLSLLLGNEFPTGNELKMTGSKHVVPSVQMLAGKKFKHAKIFANVGGRFPSQDDILGVSFNDRITYGLAVGVPVLFLDPKLDFVAQLQGSVQPTDGATNTTPMEYTAGLKKEFNNGVLFQAGIGGGLNNAIGTPRIRGVFSMGYSFDTWKKQKKASVEVVHVFFNKKSSALTGESAAWLEETLNRSASSTKPVQVTLYRARKDSVRISKKRQKSLQLFLVKNGIAAQRLNITVVDVPKIFPNDRLGKASYAEIVIPMTGR